MFVDLLFVSYMFGVIDSNITHKQYAISMQKKYCMRKRVLFCRRCARRLTANWENYTLEHQRQKCFFRRWIPWAARRNVKCCCGIGGEKSKWGMRMKWNSLNGNLLLISIVVCFLFIAVPSFIHWRLYDLDASFIEGVLMCVCVCT